MLVKFEAISILFGRIRLTKRLSLIGAALFVVLSYTAVFAVPKPVLFSYAGGTCSGQLSILPGIFNTKDKGRFALDYRGGVSVAATRLWSTKVCFTPNSLPHADIVRVESAPWGGWIFRNRYIMTVGDAPHIVHTAPTPQSLHKPLALKLNLPDRVLQYSVANDIKEQPCSVNATQLLCGVDKLGLAQGTSYTLKLKRSFGSELVGTATGIQVAIMPATKVVSVSLKADEIVYNKPKSADFSLDKPLISAVAKLDHIAGATTTAIQLNIKVDGSHVGLTWDQDLPRDSAFRLTLASAEASDGSGLDSPYIINFRTSGGPKVIGVSIGNTGVDSNARAIVTFDQALSKDAINLASINGGIASISRSGTNQIVFALRNLPRCGTFSLNIAKGVVGDNDVLSDQAWSFTSRANCGTVRTIGTSVKGKPIQAHYYGTGATTILFTGGMHGNEPSGTYIMQDWANYLDANGYKIPADKQIVVVPNINPDGIAINQRYNANNVNIDRNFPSSDWISDISLTNGQVLPHGGGVTPLSEPETRAIADLTSSLHVRAEISFHSSGALVGANKIADSTVIGSLYARGVGYGTMFDNPESVMGYTLTGEYETWMGEKFGIPAILIELPTSKGKYFLRHLNTLWSMVNL